MSSLSANVRRAAAEQTLTLPFRVPLQTWFTLQQAAAVIGIAESTVERLYEKGELTGHGHNAGEGERKHKRVHRDVLIAYMVRTADYNDETFCELFCAALPKFPPATLLKIAQLATRLATEAPLSR
jgi:hypothetical protein